MSGLRSTAWALGIMLALVTTLSLTLTPTPAIATAARSRASLTEIENDVMCVSCHESLAVAQSPQSYSERAFIRDLISQGLDKQQIESQLVSAYGPAVLGKPPAAGFNLLIYVVPPALLALGIATLAVTLPKWRGRARLTAAASPPPSGPPLNPAEARRLDEDLARQL